MLCNVFQVVFLCVSSTYFKYVCSVCVHASQVYAVHVSYLFCLCFFTSSLFICSAMCLKYVLLCVFQRCACVSNPRQPIPIPSSELPAGSVKAWWWRSSWWWTRQYKTLLEQVTSWVNFFSCIYRIAKSCQHSKAYVFLQGETVLMVCWGLKWVNWCKGEDGMVNLDDEDDLVKEEW